MAEQYWIGGFYIDLSRNQITQNGESKKLAPKALAVLTYLAQHQGKVVSQDDLLTNVWQGSVVSPNTLQRSVAQLRKALGDDGKVQVYIKTHAKKGYSLECDVRWQGSINVENNHNLETSETSLEVRDNTENIFEKPDVVKKVTDKPQPIWLSPIGIVIGVLVVCLLSYFSFFHTPNEKLSFVEMRALTATDNKEVGGIYSPDGQYVVFHRYSEELCQSNLWAKNISTQQEFQLTKNLNTYSSHSFSKDGKKLVFIQAVNCSNPINQKKCYYLKSIDFNKALIKPQEPDVLLECNNSEIRTPKWLNNNDIAMLQKFSERWQLIRYSIADNKSNVIRAVNVGNLIGYDYSVKDDVIALTSSKNDGNYYVEILTPDGQVLSSNSINYPGEISKYKRIVPKFSPIESLLVFSTGRQLFTLSYEGEVTNISLPVDAPMGTPTFHPNGKRALVIKGHYDSDIVSVSLSEIAKSTLKQTELADSYSVMERSNVAENNALFQPNGNLIAFKSSRSGQRQIWLTDSNGNTPQQLSNLPIDVFLSEFDWAQDGHSLLANADKVLIEFFLDGTETTFHFEHPVTTLFHWDSVNKTALANIRISGLVKFAELDLANLTIKLIKNREVNWAVKTSNGQLIYMDHMDRYWQSGAVESKLIEALEKQGSDKRFVISESTVYGINEDSQLWSYSLEQSKFELVGEVPNNIDNITDVNKDNVLMSIFVSGKKEIAEIVLAKE